jgi:hypothetical protein
VPFAHSVAWPRVAACDRGTFPYMGSWVGRVVRVRTSSGGTGEAYDVIMGVGASPQRALAALRSEAREWVRRMAEAPVRPAEGTPTRSVTPAGRSHDRKVTGAGHVVRAEPIGPRAEERRKALREQRVAHSGQPERRFEVVGVRLTAGVLEGGESGWLAYGTLTDESGSK